VERVEEGSDHIHHHVADDSLDEGRGFLGGLAGLAGDEHSLDLELGAGVKGGYPGGERNLRRG